MLKLLKPLGGLAWPFCNEFAWHLAHQCTDTHSLILLQSLTYCFVGFSQWLSHADRIFTLNMNIWLPLFWSTWSRARGQTCPHELAWHMGVIIHCDYGHCIALQQKWLKRQGMANVFSLNCPNYLKNNGPSRWLLNLQQTPPPRGCISLQILPFSKFFVVAQGLACTETAHK